MSTFLVVLWVIAVVAVGFGLVMALFAMSWATRDNTLETMFETLTVSAALLFLAVNGSEFTHAIFDKVYGFIRMCMGLTDSDLKFVPKMFERGELNLSIKLVIAIVFVVFLIRYIVSAEEKLLALAFLPLMLAIEIILLLAIPDRFVVTILPFFGIVLLAVLILSGAIGGSGSGSSQKANPNAGAGADSDVPTYADGTPVDPFANNVGRTYHSLKNGNEYFQQVAEYQTYIILRDDNGNTFNATKGHDGMVYDANGNYYRRNDI